MGPRRGLRR
jgi:hypothetical protein